GSASPVSSTVDEAIPKQVAASASQLKFQPAPTGVIQADPVVAYLVSLHPGETLSFHYSATVPAQTNGLAALKSWAAAVTAPAGATPALLTLATLTIAAPSVALQAGQQAALPGVSGTMSDGSAAPRPRSSPRSAGDPAMAP
ncbi:MAG: hypothetical protein ACRDJU_04970, partial [Actinomycetota bacterium]